MYAKLVVGAANINSIRAMRDIGRLLTSETPSTALLSAFSTTSSIIVDATPASWTYVGSLLANDRPTICAVGSASDNATLPGYTSDSDYNLAFSAPCLDQPSRLKYVTLDLVWRGGGVINGFTFSLTGAQSVTDQGVRTNSGPRPFAASAEGVNETGSLVNNVSAGQILHLIATPRHITIIQEGRGLNAVWETTSTDAHEFFNRPAFVQYSHSASSATTRFPIIVPTSYTTTQSPGWMAAAFAVTDVNTGTFYGTYDVSENSTMNLGSLAQNSATLRTNSINSSGSPRYQINPIFFQIGKLGYPTQFVSGPVPIYWTRNEIGSTGDEVDVAGDTYTFFNCGSGFGVIVKTS